MLSFPLAEKRDLQLWAGTAGYFADVLHAYC